MADLSYMVCVNSGNDLFLLGRITFVQILAKASFWFHEVSVSHDIVYIRHVALF